MFSIRVHLWLKINLPAEEPDPSKPPALERGHRLSIFRKNGRGFTRMDTDPDPRTSAFILFTEGVERAARTDVDASVSDRWGGVAFVVELVDSEHFPVARRFQNGHLTTLTDQKHFIVSGNRR